MPKSNQLPTNRRFDLLSIRRYFDFALTASGQLQDGELGAGLTLLFHGSSKCCVLLKDKGVVRIHLMRKGFPQRRSSDPIDSVFSTSAPTPSEEYASSNIRPSILPMVNSI